MRCIACNEELTDEEAVRKNPATQQFEDLCTPCGRIVAADLAEDTLPHPTLELDDPQFEEMLDDETN